MDNKNVVKLEESQANLIKELLKEAEEHNNVKALNDLKILAENSNVKLDENVYENVYEQKNEIKNEKKDSNIEKNINDVPSYNFEALYEIDDFDIPHDLVPLPSKGLTYKNCKSKIPVAYLTASDEDLITSPNLYVDGKVIDLLLRKKILDKNINPDDLIKGDRDAIIIWLRASGYGSNFPVNVKDPVTGEYFETEVDLSMLKIKEFKLKSDSNGYFDFTLPKTGHVVKFKFLSHRDEVNYVKSLEISNPKLKKITIESTLETYKDILSNDKNIDNKLKVKLEQSVNAITEYVNTIVDDDNISYLKNVTYLLEKSIISIEDNSDKNFIRKYIQTMPALDSMTLRKYINENTPGIDFKVEVKRPESLGGGSFETFLEFDSTIFLNIPRF